MPDDAFCKKIADEALELIKEQGLEALSMRKLAKALGFSTQKLYSNFKDKDALLLFVAKELTRHLIASNATCEDPITCVRNILECEPKVLELYLVKHNMLDLEGAFTAPVRLVVIGAIYSLVHAENKEREQIIATAIAAVQAMQS